MRKLVAFLLAFLLIFVMLSVVACKPDDSGKTDDPGTNPPSGDVNPPSGGGDNPPSGGDDPVTPTDKSIKLVLSSTDEVTVAAGANVTLPTFTATDYNGTDLTADVEIEDPAEAGTVKDGVFNARIAGEHNLYYYVEVADEEAEDGMRYAEYTLKVTVTPATANTFETNGHDDVNQMTNYGVFKDGFEAGKKSPLGAAIGDANNAAYITGTSEAIEGNSLVIDFNRTSGSALNGVFLSAFNNTFHRGKLATYKVKFSYKIITADGNTGDIYFGLSWDGFDGNNGKFVSSSAEVGKTYTYETQFTSVNVPEAGNAYFVFFKLSGSTSDVIIAVDNFEIETVYVTPVTSVVPTAEQLESENGFTWNFGANGATCTNGETVSINDLGEALKNAMAANNHFHDNVLKLTNADGHIFSGLTKDNLVTEKKLIIDLYYYAVNDGGFHIIMMANGAGSTMTITNEPVSEGSKIKHVHMEAVVPSWDALNIYGQGNSSFEIYIGEISVKLVDNVVETGKTPLDHVIGDYTFTQEKRGFGGNADKGVSSYDNYDFGDVNTKNQMGPDPQKIKYSNVASDWNIEWFNAGGKVFETGYWYRITMVYYVVKYEGGIKLQYNVDNAVFLPIGEGDYMSAGYHVSSIKWQATSNSNFFSIYDKKADDAESLSAEYYIKHIKVELINEDDPTVVTTGKGHEVGNYSVTWSSREFGEQTDGNWTSTAYDDYNFGDDAAAMGTAPTKFTLNGVKDATMLWRRPANQVLENGHKYAITIRYYVVSWEGGRMTLNFDNNVFPEITSSPEAGYHETTIEWTATRDVDFFSFYVPGDTTISAVLYIADVTVSLIG